VARAAAEVGQDTMMPVLVVGLIRPSRAVGSSSNSATVSQVVQALLHTLVPGGHGRHQGPTQGAAPAQASTSCTLRGKGQAAGLSQGSGQGVAQHPAAQGSTPQPLVAPGEAPWLAGPGKWVNSIQQQGVLDHSSRR
jgi:hypothetical protein